MKKCFVIMPFSETTKEHDEAYWNNFFEKFIKPALAAYSYEVEKSVAAPNNITKQIVRELAMADLVLAVLTDGKPNVFYELGVRHSLRQGTIMILEEEKQRPFDISNYGIISYSDTKPDKFKKDLEHYIQIAERMSEDSPVADFLNQKITVSVNLAIGKLRQCSEVLKQSKTFDAGVTTIKELQKFWNQEQVQVSIVCNDKMIFHCDPGTQNDSKPEDWWRDELSDTKPLYPFMKEQRSGFRIVQIREKKSRLTALAWETIQAYNCLIVTEAHYIQENKPY